MGLTYDRRGQGSPLLLLPGIGMSWQAWLPVLDLLATEHEVIAVDLPGLGGASAPLPTGMLSSVETLTNAIEDFIEEQGLVQPHVAGNSLDGAIALELARRGVVRSATAVCGK